MFEDFTWRVSDCEELVGEVNHTTESVTDLFSFFNEDLCDPIQTSWIKMVILRMRLHVAEFACSD